MENNRKTLQQKLSERRIKHPPAIVYVALGYLWRLLYRRRLNINFDYRIDPKAFMKGPCFVVSNHTSRLDYIYTGLAFLPQRLNYVAGYNEFFRSHLAFIFRLLQIIPKRNFVPDIYTARSIKEIISRGGKVIVFPEGMSSIGGSNQPCALGSGNLLKHYGIPVLMTKIKGGYLTNTKYCLDERPGRVDVVIDILFTPEDLAGMTADEVQLRLDEALHHDDYAWNKEERIAFDGGGRMAHNLHHLLYRCPKCEREFTMKGEGNTITCTACGNGATVNDYYDLIPFDATCVIPETPRVWYDLEREHVRRDILREDFELREKVTLGMLPEYNYLKNQDTSIRVGEGELVLDRRGLHYRGTKNDAPFSLDIPSHDVPTYGMCTDVTFFYTFYRGIYYEFTPRTESTAKWLLATEENHRANGGRWKNFPGADTYGQKAGVIPEK